MSPASRNTPLSKSYGFLLAQTWAMGLRIAKLMIPPRRIKRVALAKQYGDKQEVLPSIRGMGSRTASSRRVLGTRLTRRL